MLDNVSEREREQRPEKIPTLHGLNENPQSSRRLLHAFVRFNP
jgi:hypothetical protein